MTVRIEIEGHLGQVPAYKVLADTRKAEFTVCSSKRRRLADGSWKADKSLWLRVVAWNDLADAARSLKAGAPVIVSGELLDDSYMPEGANKPVFRVMLRASTLGLNITRVHEYSFITHKEAEQQMQFNEDI